jgi:hypothetical protein
MPAFTPPEAVKFDPAMWQAARADSANKMNAQWDNRMKGQFDQEKADFAQQMADSGISWNSDVYGKRQAPVLQKQANQQNDAYALNDAAAAKEILDIENVNQGRQKLANDAYFQGQDLGLRTDQFNYDKLDRDRVFGLDQSKFDYDKLDRDRNYGLDQQKFTYDMRQGDRDYELNLNKNNYEQAADQRDFGQKKYEFGKNYRLDYRKEQFNEKDAKEKNSIARIAASRSGGGGGGGLQPGQSLIKATAMIKAGRRAAGRKPARRSSTGTDLGRGAGSVLIPVGVNSI